MNVGQQKPPLGKIRAYVLNLIKCLRANAVFLEYTLPNEQFLIKTCGFCGGFRIKPKTEIRLTSFFFFFPFLLAQECQSASSKRGRKHAL